MQKKDTVELFTSGIASKPGNKSSLFMSNIQRSNVPANERLNLTPVEFMYQHYDIVGKVGDFLNRKYGQEINEKTREELVTDSYNDIVSILAENKLLPLEKWTGQYVDIILAELFGYGILEPLLNDKKVDEIMVVAHDKIFVEVSGQLMKTDFRFHSVEVAKGIVTRFIAPLNKRLDSSCPNVDAQLPDGSRLSATIAPIRANDEISITIRKFKETVEELSYYVEKYQSESQEMADFLEAAVYSEQSLIVSGGTGSGKTTLLNSLSFAIPNSQRVLTIEDTLELRLQQDNVESYQTVSPNMEGKGGTDMEDLIIISLRKRPDRIIVGECRSGEIVEMLNAMNTGHEGSMSTLHANSPEEMITRAATMIRSNPSTAHLSDQAIFELLDTVSLIVQTNRLIDGSRRITSITEVVGVGRIGYDRLMNQGLISPDTPVENKLYLQDIFRFVFTETDEDGKVHGYFETTGYVPQLLKKMRQFGYEYEDSFFMQRCLLEV